MRTLPFLLVALTLTAASGAHRDGRAGAQERPRARPAPAPDPEAQERRRVRVTEDGDVVEGDVVIEREPGRVFVWRDGGVVRRAALGIELTPGSAADTLGVRVEAVAPGSAAERAGVEPGDRIVSVDGRDVRLPRADADDPEIGDLSARRIRRALEGVRPGDDVALELRRGRERRTVTVRAGAAGRPGTVGAFGMRAAPHGGALRAMPGRARMRVGAGSADTVERRAWEERARSLRDSARARAERRPALGLVLQPTGAARDTLGLFVARVTTGGPAERAGIVEGDRIAAIDGVDVRVPREDVGDAVAAGAHGHRFTRELLRRSPGTEVTLRIWRGDAARTVTARLGNAADVFADQGGVAFGFGALDGVPLPPLPPLAPRPRVAPMAPLPPGADVQIWRFGPGGDLLEAPRAPRPPRIRWARPRGAQGMMI
jgi:hypothetical protein